MRINASRRNHIQMAKLVFRYGAMNSGKSTALLQVAHNYEERGQTVVLLKPSTDTKGADSIVSRLGVRRPVDILVSPEDDLRSCVSAWLPEPSRPEPASLACVLIDEAQFLSTDQVDQALAIAVLENIPVLAFGIRTDFKTQSFPGSQRLLEVAHSLEEMKTICRCGQKAIFNGRFGADGLEREGSQVMIDGPAVKYEALCGRCYLLGGGKKSD